MWVSPKSIADLKPGQPVLWGSCLYRFDRISGSGADILFKEKGVGFHSNLAHTAMDWAKENLKVIKYEGARKN